MGRSGKITCRNVFLNDSVSREEFTKKWADLFYRFERHEQMKGEPVGGERLKKEHSTPVLDDRWI